MNIRYADGGHRKKTAEIHRQGNKQNWKEKTNHQL